MALSCDDAVAARATTQIHDLPPAGQVHLLVKTAGSTHPDGIGGLVILARPLDRKGLVVHAEATLIVLADLQMLGELPPGFPAGLAEPHPRSRIAGTTPHQKTIHVFGVDELVAIAAEQLHGRQRDQQPFRIHRLYPHRRSRRLDAVVTVRNHRERVELHRAHQRSGLPECLADALQPDGIRARLLPSAFAHLFPCASSLPACHCITRNRHGAAAPGLSCGIR